MNLRYILIIKILLILCHHVLTWSWNPTCLVSECCNSDYIPADLEELKFQLDDKVYGQHLVTHILVNALQDHLGQDNPQKALTLSFHGWPGIGKNYVVKFIINSLYKKGALSKFVHQFTQKIDFPELDAADYYSRNLYQLIKSKLVQCPRQIFIFDEVDKMPPGVFNGITPVLDTHEFIDGVDFRKAIFIFISNTGGKLIADRLYELNSQGLKREELQLYHFEHLIRLGAFNEQGGFQYSESISSNLIDHYIPFLPLERKHVQQCMETEFLKRKFKNYEHLFEEVMEYVTFDSNGNGFFATTGCKRVDQKVGTVVERERNKNRFRTDL